VSDAHEGLMNAIAQVLGCPWQRCTVPRRNRLRIVITAGVLLLLLASAPAASARSFHYSDDDYRARAVALTALSTPALAGL
jgi:hypothetical protein